MIKLKSYRLAIRLAKLVQLYRLYHTRNYNRIYTNFIRNVSLDKEINIKFLSHSDPPRIRLVGSCMRSSGALDK